MFLVEVKYEKNPQYIYKITNQIIKHRDYSDIWQRIISEILKFVDDTFDKNKYLNNIFKYHKLELLENF